MSKEKQIEDFENDLRECHTEFSVSDDSMDIYTDYKITAQNMIGKGWSKQSEGEWVDKNIFFAIYKCSICGEENLYKDGHGCLSKFCPNCGAKMKSGAK